MKNGRALATGGVVVLLALGAWAWRGAEEAGRGSAQERRAQLDEQMPPKVDFECGTELACVARKAADLEGVYGDAGRAEAAGAARELRVALEAGDCRAAMAANGRVEAIDLDRNERSPVFRARHAVFSELLNACLLGAPRRTPLITGR